MLKLTKTAIGLLTKQYRSVLRKCLLLNLGVFALTAANTIIQQNAYALTEGTASGNVSIAIGFDSRAINHADIAIGYGTIASGISSVSLGDYSRAKGVFSVAVGMHALASGNSSVALGNYSTANEDGVISVGHLAGDKTFDEEETYSSDYFRRIVNVAEGSGAHDAVTVSQLGNIASGTKILNANGESAITFGTESGQTTVGTAISNVANQLYNYYYTFRVDERVEAIEFAEELRSNKKEMSSLDFMPIKSSSDLRINLIKAEDPLTFSAKTRDDSLVLMEVCHA